MPDARSGPPPAVESFRFPPLPQRQSLVGTVVEQLTRRIESGEVAPDARLPAETELCRQFAVSRTVVREAVARLKAEQLVETRPGLGLYVARRGPGQGVLRLRAPEGSAVERSRELLEFRAGLEADAARLAALRRTDEDVVAIRAALDRIDAVERAGGNGGAEDLDFHMAIARASRNGYIVQVLRFLSGTLQDAIAHGRELSARRREHVEAAQREHRLVLDAIIAGDPDAAMRRMRRHLTQGERRLLAATHRDQETPR